MTVHEKMWRAAGVSVHTHRRLPRDEISGKRHDISEQKIAVESTTRIAKNPNFYSTSNRRDVPSVMTKTKVLVWMNGKIVILFEDQLYLYSSRPSS